MIGLPYVLYVKYLFVASVVSESGLLQDVTCSGADAASGVQKVNMSPNKTSYNKGECILYTCKDDYKYRAGSLSRVCEDGSWSGNAPVCTGMR